MAYPVGVERRTQKQPSKLIPEIRDRVEAALRALADDPRPPGSRRLQGRPGYRGG
jgi:mRNA interferase RelE/StbE